MCEISQTWDSLYDRSILHALRGISIKIDCRISVRLENSNDLNISVLQASGVIPSFGGAGVGEKPPAAGKVKPQRRELF